MNANWIVRHYESVSDDLIKKGKVLVVTGPRRVGKTELVKKMIKGFQGKIYMGTGDDLDR